MSALKVNTTDVEEKVQDIISDIDDLDELVTTLYRRMTGEDVDFWTGESFKKFKSYTDEESSKYKKYLENLRLFANCVNEYNNDLNKIIKEIEAGYE